MKKSEILKQAQDSADSFNHLQSEINLLLDNFDNETNIEKKQAMKDIIEQKINFLDSLADEYTEFVKQIKN